MSSQSPERGIRVAVAGIRGVPANFGGSETAVEEIGRRLVALGDDVLVYCRRHNSTTDVPAYLGMRRKVLPSISTFNLDTLSHSVIAALDIRLRNTADVVHFHGVGNGLALPLLIGSRKRTVITIDGPDWERPKWGRWARIALRLGALLAVRLADEVIIDNQPSLDYFRRHFGVTGHFITYGADTEALATTEYIESLGLRPRGYVLFVGALVPDKGPDVLIDAWRQVETDMPLVIVGDSPFARDFRQRLRDAADKDHRVRMLGYVRGDRYRELVSHAYVYAHPLRSDGTSPALLQALGYGNCVVVNELPEALAAVGDAAIAYQSNDSTSLARVLQELIERPDVVEEYRQRATRKVRDDYNWDRVTAQHRDVYRRALRLTSDSPADH